MTALNNGQRDPDKNKPNITSNPTRTYVRQSSWANNMAGAVFDGHPIFTWMDIPRMLKDERVNFCLRMLTGQFQKAKWTVNASNPAVTAFVMKTLKRFWRGYIGKIMRKYYTWGYCPIGFRYSHETKRGRVGLVTLSKVDIFEPRDVQARVFAKGPRKGEFAGFTFPGGEAYLPHAMWFAGEAELDEFHDLPRLAGAFAPWLEKRGAQGAIPLRNLWVQKCAFRSPTIRFPANQSINIGTDESPVYMSAYDYARQLGENGASGSVDVMPNDANPNMDGKYAWEREPAQSITDNASVMEYPDKCDKAIDTGMGIPHEVIEASDVGSGWSGRQIPAEAFYSSIDDQIHGVFEAFDKTCLRYLVALNFGPGVDYEVDFVPLSEVVFGKKPDANGGGDGKGSELTPVQPSTSGGEQAGFRKELAPAQMDDQQTANMAFAAAARIQAIADPVLTSKALAVLANIGQTSRGLRQAASGIVNLSHDTEVSPVKDLGQDAAVSILRGVARDGVVSLSHALGSIYAASPVQLAMLESTAITRMGGRVADSRAMTQRLVDSVLMMAQTIKDPTFERLHPRDKDGKWIEKSQLMRAAVDPEARSHLESQVHPEDKEKLSAAIEAVGKGDKSHGGAPMLKDVNGKPIHPLKLETAGSSSAMREYLREIVHPDDKYLLEESMLASMERNVAENGVKPGEVLKEGTVPDDIKPDDQGEEVKPTDAAPEPDVKAEEEQPAPAGEPAAQPEPEAKAEPAAEPQPERELTAHEEEAARQAKFRKPFVPQPGDKNPRKMQTMGGKWILRPQIIKAAQDGGYAERLSQKMDDYNKEKFWEGVLDAKKGVYAWGNRPLKPREKKWAQTLVGEVFRRGGIRSDDSAIIGTYGSFHDAVNNGVPLKIFNNGAKNSIDGFASSLEAQGMFQTPKDRNQEDYFLELLVEGATDAHADESAKWAKAEDDYYREKHEAEQAAASDPAVTPEVLRSVESQAQAEAQNEFSGEPDWLSDTPTAGDSSEGGGWEPEELEGKDVPDSRDEGAVKGLDDKPATAAGSDNKKNNRKAKNPNVVKAKVRQTNKQSHIGDSAMKINKLDQHPIHPESAEKFAKDGQATAWRIHDVNKPIPKKSANMWTDSDEEMPGTSGFANLSNALDDMLWGVKESATGENYTSATKSPAIVAMHGKSIDGPGAEIIVPNAKVSVHMTKADIEKVAKEAFKGMLANPADADEIDKMSMDDIVEKYGSAIDGEVKDEIEKAVLAAMKVKAGNKVGS